MTKTQKTQSEAKAKTESTMEALGLEIPADVREMAEKSVDQAKVVYGQFREAAQETVDMLDTSATAFKTGSEGFHLKTLDFTQANVNAGFDFARKLIAATDIKDVFALQTEFAREQTQAMTEQAKELTALSTGVAEKAVKPIKDGMTKSAAQVKSAFKG